MRWGSAFTTSPLVFEDTPCMTVKTAMLAAATPLLPNEGDSVVFGSSQRQQQQQQQQQHACSGRPGMFVLAGDYCTTESSKGGYAAAVLSGLSAARALMHGLQSKQCKERGEKLSQVDPRENDNKLG
eukprot:scaffold131158_cov18-Tisochrysis_lutea.AAC.2